MKIITGYLTGWELASRTASIKVKYIASLLPDRSILDKLLVDTLEGKEYIGNDVVICVGAAGDIWQQTPKNLLDKYNVVAIEADGWMVCRPKPENMVNCIEVTELRNHNSANCFVEFPDDHMYNMGDFAIEGRQWGDTDYPELGKNIQWGHLGDFICQSRTDPADVWIVRRKLFLNTYVKLTT
jgi:hypothetical protein